MVIRQASLMNPCRLSTSDHRASLLPPLFEYHQLQSFNLRIRQQHSRCLTSRRGKVVASRSYVGSRGHDRDNVKRTNEATEFIDEKIMDAMAQKPGLIKQIVLLTDGIDDWINRLPWPPLTVIFHVSSVPINIGINGNEVPKACLVRHVYVNLKEPTEESWTENFRNAGFQGDKPSLWAIQDMDYWEIVNFPNVLRQIGELAMQGSLLIGNLSSDSVMNKDAVEKQLESSFMGSGFRIKTILQNIESDHDCYIFFVAEHLRLSNDQIDKVLQEMELAEESGDEETFEDW